MEKETISSLQGQNDEELLKLLNEKIEDKSFANIVKYQLKLAEKQSSKNKNTYFCICEAIIILTGATSIVNAFITQGTNFFIKLCCVIFPVIANVLLAIKNERKFDETWKRHVNRYVALQLETSYYVYNLKKYRNEDEIEKENMYKESIMEILKGNYKTFERNMSDSSTKNVNN